MCIYYIYSVKNKKMSINQRSSTVVPLNFRLEVEKLLRNILMVVVQVAYFHSEIKSVIKKIVQYRKSNDLT